MGFPLIKPGLVSISFRDLSPEELLKEAASAGLKGIEWGGDVHVPHGDTATAEAVASATMDAGLEIAAFGSYYRLGKKEDNPEFEAVLDSAVALKAPTLRVWAGPTGSADADEDIWQRVTDDARRVCDLAAAQGVRICLEYHGGTLTDSIDAAVRLLEEVPHPNLDTLWQPPNGQTDEHCEKSLRSVLPRVSNLHVFHWGMAGSGDRRPLSEGHDRWNRFFEIAQTPPRPRWALMEFVKDNSLEQLHTDAKTLHSILA